MKGINQWKNIKRSECIFMPFSLLTSQWSHNDTIFFRLCFFPKHLFVPVDF